jgi:DNA-binding response OmpR family regulator
LQKVLLLYASEGASLLKRDLDMLDLDVEAAPVGAAEAALTQPGTDALILESAANLDETRRLIDAPFRPRLPLMLLVRADQVGQIDPTWAIDDFIVVPALPAELALRLRRAIWRRTGLDAANVLRSGDLMLDLANYKVFVAEQPVNLTFKEFELLRFLVTNRGKVFTREALLNRVWGYEYFGGARTVDVHIRRLRSKIETGSTVWIETVRNVGYRFPA